MTIMNARDGPWVDPDAGIEDMLTALRDPACYPHPVRRVEILQTHISWVILTGDYAYKIKKPVNLGFLDFTSLEARHHYCEEELRLNLRFAPSLYLKVVPITGSSCQPRIDGDGPALEYAVKMREFPQAALLDVMLARDEVTPDLLQALAAKIAEIHAMAPSAIATPGVNTTIGPLAPALDNFKQMHSLLQERAGSATLDKLRDWTMQEHRCHASLFTQRLAAGRVRECHGDLHLGNIALVNSKPTPFDCIEFDPALRWIDVMSELAFPVMDLEAHGRRDLAWAFLNTYLEAGGDYDGVAVLPFYLVYRAVVRAKVSLLRAAQPDVATQQGRRKITTCLKYLELAETYTRPRSGAVIITHGLSGSGKTTLTQPLIAKLGALRIRSDVERKRMHGLAAQARSNSAVAAGIYTGKMTSNLYALLRAHARSIAGAGFPALIDATFLKRGQRQMFRKLAAELRVPFAIISFTAPRDELRARIAARAANGADASEATLEVLDAQIAALDPLRPDELENVISLNGKEDVETATRKLSDALR